MTVFSSTGQNYQNERTMRGGIVKKIVINQTS